MQADARWRARLSLAFADDRGTTRLVERRHEGPLRVQKPLYPEGGKVCHAIVVHPPGGVVGGDELHIAARVDAGASAFLTTPGAAKWYKSNGRVSRQDVDLHAGPGASLEWLPQETIFFDDARVCLDNHITLDAGASYLGGEILCFGRTASGESFRSGCVEQRTSVRRDGRLLWFEQGTLAAGEAATTGPLGLQGSTVCAMLLAVGNPLPAAAMAALRGCGDGMRPGTRTGATQIKSLVVARLLGDSSEEARQWMARAWQVLRPALTGREAVIPRIWNT
ncbi:MAG TPA: urease accessory protein UreD [Noviherbaspirillum sp.]|uniref:urease accessory protein UreD n=1 Tax=Noviherbaspirillum sp. TaxID=1926288 RepID=UPI002F956F94